MNLTLDFFGCDGSEDAIWTGGAGEWVGMFVVLVDVAGMPTCKSTSRQNSDCSALVENPRCLVSVFLGADLR